MAKPGDVEGSTGQVRSNHPARTWVEGQEKQAASGTQAKGTLDVKECSEILEQIGICNSIGLIDPIFRGAGGVD